MKVVLEDEALYLRKLFLFVALTCLLAGFAFASPASAGESVYNFEDQYVRIEAGISSGEGKGAFGLEVRMTPKPEWKLCASSTSGGKPLNIKFAASKCFKAKGATRYSPPDLAGTDDSGAYSEYYTKTASVRQEFTRLKCSKGGDGAATLTYLLCQDNRCVGPFSKEIRFKAPEK